MSMSMTVQLPRSARSSASSSAPTHLLTPVYELDGIADSAIASSSGSSSSGADDRDVDGDGDVDGGDDTPRAEDGGLTKSLSTSSSNARHAAPPPSLIPLESPPLPSTSFSFGSCPSVPLSATPTSELGPFDYPLPPGAASASSIHGGPSSSGLANPLGSPRRQSLALGMTHRRGSIVAASRSPVEPSTSTLPSPPATYRSSTCSTITTLPAAGHRPAILHSASTTSGGVPLANPPVYPHLHTQSPPTSRRTSLLFPQRPSVAPIPPSLLARRGSLPAAQLFGVPSSEMNPSLNRMGGGPGGRRERASFAGQGTSSGYATSTPALYARRASLLSDDGTSGSGSSTSTVTAAADDAARTARRSSVFATTTSSSSSAVPSSAPTSPKQPTIAQRRLRRRSADSRSAGTAPSGSEGEADRVDEEENEAEEDSEEGESLPTPATASSVGFTDPWSTTAMKQALSDEDGQ